MQDEQQGASAPNQDSGAEGASQVETPAQGEGQAAAAAGTEVKPPVKTEKDILSSRLNKLAQKDKELTLRAKELKQKEEKLANLEKLEQELEEDFLAVAEKRGWTYEKITQQVLGREDKDPSVRALEKKMQEIEKEKQDLARKAQDEQNQKNIAAWTSKAKELIKTHAADKYEICSSLEEDDEAIRMAMSMTESYFNATAAESEDGKGIVIPIETALDWAEEYFEKKGAKLIKSKKLEKYRVAAAPATTEVKENKDEVSEAVMQSSKKRTLSNDLDSQTPSDKVKPLSPEERRAKAREILKSMK